MGLSLDTFLCAMEVWAIFVCLLASAFSFFSNKTGRVGMKSMTQLQLCCVVLMTADVVAYYYLGRPGAVAAFLVRLGYFFDFALPYVCAIFFVNYINCFFTADAKTRKLVYGIFILAGIGIVSAIVNLPLQFYYYIDENSYYHRSETFYGLLIPAGIALVILLVIIQHNREELGINKTIAFLSYVFFPIVSILLQTRGYTRIARMNIGFALSILFMSMMLFVEQNRDIYRQKEELLDKKEELVRQEKKINDMQIRLVISQIQPHFLYNALNSIYYLCERNPGDAQEAIVNFSSYLRGNMDALRATEPIPFSTELSHVKSYLALEKMRFEDELEVVLDIETEDFLIPALCLQPIVENAVKHGVGNKPEGGTVNIRTRLMHDSIEIIVSDDGIGFDVNAKQEDGRSHVGLENVRTRLEEMVGGSLYIRSKVNEGTVVSIQIPREEA
ncbi:MAG: histidine kinase [Lachnospiraceae bacterium]|nr:histidine kinase [Lachnospiraceae bacterium]